MAGKKQRAKRCVQVLYINHISLKLVHQMILLTYPKNSLARWRNDMENIVYESMHITPSCKLGSRAKAHKHRQAIKKR